MRALPPLSTVLVVAFAFAAEGFEPGPPQTLPAGAPAPAPGAHTRVRVAWNGLHFLAVWEDDRRMPGSPDLFGLRLRRDGTLIDSTARLLVDDGREHAVGFGDGRWLVSAVHARTGAPDLFAHFFDADLWPLGNPVAVTPSNGTADDFSYLGWSATQHEFLVAWRDASTSYASVVSFDGGAGPTLVVGSDTLSGRPIVEASGRFLIARTAPGPGGGTATTRWSNTDGGFSPDVTVPFANGDSTSIALAFGASRGVLAVSENTGSGYDVKVRSVDVNGVANDAPATIGHHTTGRLSLWAAAAGPDQMFLTYNDDLVAPGSLTGTFVDTLHKPLLSPRAVQGTHAGPANPAADCTPDGTCAIGFNSGGDAVVSLVSIDGGLVTPAVVSISTSQFAATAAGGSQGPVALWQTGNLNGPGGGQLFAGRPGGPVPTLLSSTLANAKAALVAVPGGFLAAWTQGSDSLCLAALDAQGVPTGGPVPACDTTGRRAWPSMAWDPAHNRVVMAWQNLSTTPHSVWWRAYSTLGVPLGAAVSLYADGSLEAEDPSVAAGDGLVAIAHGAGATAGPRGVVLHVLNGAQSTSDGGLALAPPLASQPMPVPVRLPGGFAVVWQHDVGAAQSLRGAFAPDLGPAQAPLELVPLIKGSAQAARVGNEVAVAWVGGGIQLAALSWDGGLSLSPPRSALALPSGSDLTEPTLGEGLDGTAWLAFTAGNSLQPDTWVMVEPLLPAGAGPGDGGQADGGSGDGGAPDGGPTDGGEVDGGTTDGGPDQPDGGPDDGGHLGRRQLTVGCGCQAGAVDGPVLLALLALARRRPTARRASAAR